MSLFQKSVEKNYLKLQDTKEVEKAFKKYTKYFHNPTIQQNIRESKEEQFQEGFLRELFVNVFDYTLNPNPNFNLTTELKNEKGAKKADGAILKEGQAIAVIELKSTKTKDLESIRQQAFDYKANQSGCVYVITSNFEKLRFYINNAVEFEEFDLFTLNEERFALLYLCLHKENVLNNKPLKAKQDSVVEEESITKKFYANYSLFKRELYRDLVKENMKNEVFRNELQKEDTDNANKNIKRTLFKKSQKLIDRFLFIFFAEDRGLLPPNSTLKILEDWKKLSDLDAEVPLYNRFKLYFKYLDVGRKGTDKKAEIFAYNGGLFKPDSVLDSLILDDKLLYKHTKALSDYDFESQVDVNILGHIFENSLNEIESVNAEIEGIEFDKQTTKRKKDGVFYTPKYITKYIVDNTIGKLCVEKKSEIGIDKIDFSKSYKLKTTRSVEKETKVLTGKGIIKTIEKKKTSLSVEGFKHIESLDKYREFLLNLTILDPACGSGAFLNQALDFLIKEHQFIDELHTKLSGGGFVFPNIENTVLEKNIYGVDLNEESIEIAKLSLWLRTAQPRRKLNILSNNIKCGNSLIDNKAVAGEKAFNWQDEFSEVFEKGGFDVVIGNPPYVNMNTFPKHIHIYFEKAYSKIHTGYNDLMYYFLFKGISLLKDTGIFSVITSNYFIGNDYAKGLRVFLSDYLTKLINFENYHVFKDANIHTAIILAEPKPKLNKIGFYTYLRSDTLNEIVINQKDYKLAEIQRSDLGESWIIANEVNQKLLSKIADNNVLLGSISEIAKGSESGKNEIFTVTREIIKEYNLESEIMRKCVKNSNINSYFISFNDSFLIYTDNSFTKEKYPNVYAYLKEFKESLLERRGPRTGEYDWWRLHRPSLKQVFDSNEKILVPYRANYNKFGYDNKQYFNNGGDIRAIRITDESFKTKYIIGLLNSSLLNWYYGFIGKPKGNAREYFNKPLSQIPITKISIKNQDNYIVKVDFILKSFSELENMKVRFKKYLMSKYSFSQISKKLQNWFELEFGMFIIELNKVINNIGKDRISKSDEMDWMEVFETKKNEIQKLKSEIDKTNKEIDQMVYGLYGLTEEEINIIEAN